MQDLPIKLQHKDTWSGTYREVRFEIVRFKPEYVNHDIWCYYIYIPGKMIGKENYRRVFIDRSKKDEYGHRWYREYQSIIGDLDWHGGCTFYDITENRDGSDKVLKAGCDYDHLWDEERDFDYDQIVILRDVKATIDSLHAKIELLKRDPYDGTWDKPEVANQRIEERKAANQKG